MTPCCHTSEQRWRQPPYLLLLPLLLHQLLHGDTGSLFPMAMWCWPHRHWVKPFYLPPTLNLMMKIPSRSKIPAPRPIVHTMEKLVLMNHNPPQNNTSDVIL